MSDEFTSKIKLVTYLLLLVEKKATTKMQTKIDIFFPETSDLFT